jgi:hypothetical protein
LYSIEFSKLVNTSKRCHTPQYTVPNSLSKRCLCFSEQVFSVTPKQRALLVFVQAHVLAEQVSGTEHVQDNQMSKLRLLSKTRAEA